MIPHHDTIELLSFLARESQPEFQAPIRAILSAFERIMDDRQRDEMRARPADDLELSIRSLNAIEKLGLKTIGEVERFLDRKDEEILIITKAAPYHFGKKRLREVREVLKNIGLLP